MYSTKVCRVQCMVFVAEKHFVVADIWVLCYEPRPDTNGYELKVMKVDLSPVKLCNLLQYTWKQFNEKRTRVFILC